MRWLVQFEITHQRVDCAILGNPVFKNSRISRVRCFRGEKRPLAFIRKNRLGVFFVYGEWCRGGGDDVDRFGLANNGVAAAAAAVRRVASDAAFTRFDTRGDVTSRLLTSCGGGGLSVTATNRRRFDDDLSRLPAENNRITALRNPGGIIRTRYTIRHCLRVRRAKMTPSATG